MCYLVFTTSTRFLLIPTSDSSLSLALIPPSLFSIARLRDTSDDNVCMSPKVEESGCVCHARDMLWSHV